MINSLVLDLELKVAIHDEEIYSTANLVLRILKVAKFLIKSCHTTLCLSAFGATNRCGDSQPPNHEQRTHPGSHFDCFPCEHNIWILSVRRERVCLHGTTISRELALDYGLSPWSNVKNEIGLKLELLVIIWLCRVARCRERVSHY